MKKNKQSDLGPEILRDFLNESEQLAGEEGIHAENDLSLYAKQYASPPSDEVKNKILAKLAVLNQQKKAKKSIPLSALPLLNADSNWLEWKETVAEIHVPEDLENIHLHPLLSDETRDLFVAFVKETVPEEVHHDLLESFVILEGSCECLIMDTDGHSRKVWMREGDFINFKIGEIHDIQITSAKPVKAILQWLKLTA